MIVRRGEMGHYDSKGEMGHYDGEGGDGAL